MYQGDPAALVAGQPFDGELPTEPTEERAELVVRDGGSCSLLLYFTEFGDETDAAMDGRSRFAAITARGVLTLGFRLSDQFQWSFTSYHHGASPSPAPLGDEPDRALRLVAVDASTGEVKRVREGEWPDGFAKVVHDELVRQAGEPVEPDEVDRRAVAVHGGYPTTKKLLAIARATASMTATVSTTVTEEAGS